MMMCLVLGKDYMHGLSLCCCFYGFLLLLSLPRTDLLSLRQTSEVFDVMMLKYALLPSPSIWAFTCMWR